MIRQSNIVTMIFENIQLELSEPCRFAFSMFVPTARTCTGQTSQFALLFIKDVNISVKLDTQLWLLGNSGSQEDFTVFVKCLTDTSILFCLFPAKTDFLFSRLPSTFLQVLMPAATDNRLKYLSLMSLFLN